MLNEVKKYGLSAVELEAAALDPNRPDPLEQWNRLRPQRPQRAPCRKLDTEAAREAQERRWAEWNEWCEAKILETWTNVYSEAIAAFSVERGAALRKELRDEIAELRRELTMAKQRVQKLERDHAPPVALRLEIWDLRRELNMARKEIKALKADQSKSSNSIVGWKLNREKFQAVPFFADGNPGPPINLRVLFEQYHTQAAS